MEEIDTLKRITFVAVDTLDKAHEICPWAADIQPSANGWLCFEDQADSKRWIQEQGEVERVVNSQPIQRK